MQQDSLLQAVEMSTTSERIDNPSQSLLSLPTEIREHIYRFVLCAKDNSLSTEQTDVRLQQPPLTRTCRLIRAETLTIFYGKNEFHTTIYKRHINGGAPFRMIGFNAIWNGDDLMLWLSSIGEDNVGKLSVIVFWGDHSGVKAHFTSGKKFRLSRLEEVQAETVRSNTVVSWSDELEKKIMSFDISHISRCEYICWIRDMLVVLPRFQRCGKARKRRELSKPYNLTPEIPRDSKMRLELLLR